MEWLRTENHRAAAAADAGDQRAGGVTRGHLFGLRFHLDPVPFPLVGSVLRSFSAFRNNAAYARYVEAPDLGAHRERRARPDVAGRHLSAGRRRRF
jgi:hypothetical protein